MHVGAALRVPGDTYNVEGSIASLEIEITAAAIAGGAVRYQTIDGLSPGEVWSVDCYFRNIALSTGMVPYIMVQWFTAADVEISQSTKQLTIAGIADWAKASSIGTVSLLNMTAPATTAKLRITIGLAAQAGATGKVGFDMVRAENASAISTRLTRPVWNEWAVDP